MPCISLQRFASWNSPSSAGIVIIECRATAVGRFMVPARYEIARAGAERNVIKIPVTISSMRIWTCQHP